MAKVISTVYEVRAPGPIDKRLQVPTFAGLNNIAVIYHGIKVYVEDENKEYRYYTSSGWQEWSSNSSGGAGVWGSITGNIQDQTDLLNSLNAKFDKVGGTITGETTVLNDLYANNLIIFGSAPTVEFPYAQSTIVGEPSGSSKVSNIVFISQVNYDAAVLAGTLVVGTHYIIT